MFWWYWKFNITLEYLLKEIPFKTFYFEASHWNGKVDEYRRKSIREIFLQSKLSNGSPMINPQTGDLYYIHINFFLNNL